MAGNSGVLHESVEEALNRQNAVTNATYASVLSHGTSLNNAAKLQQQQQQQQQQSRQVEKSQEKDPFAALRELGRKSNGYYNYFQ
jgi:hypothetical protein